MGEQAVWRGAPRLGPETLLRWPEIRSPSELAPVGSYRGTDAMLTSPAEDIGQDRRPAHGGSSPMALEAQCGEGRGSERGTQQRQEWPVRMLAVI